MADEVKDVVETTEAAPEGEAKKDGKKKVNIDTAKIKDGAGKGLNKVKEFFTTKASTAKYVVLGVLALDALIAFSSGIGTFVLSLILNGVVGYGLFVSYGVDDKADAPAEEEKTEE